MDFLSDAQIHALLGEQKELGSDFRQGLVLKPKRGHEEFELDVVGAAGSEFRLVVRRSRHNPLDFSIILAYRPPGSSVQVRLRRYNGKSHEHTNPLEGQTFYDFHIHSATERYQRSGNREDTYAEMTDRYVSVDGAIGCLIQDCSIVMPRDTQGKLFPL